MCITKTCAQDITGFNNQLEWSPPQAHQIKIWLRLALNQSQNVKIKFVFTFPLRKQHNNNWTLSQKNNNWTHRLNSRRAFEMCFFFPDLSVEPSLCYCKSGLWSFTVYVKYQHPWSHTSLSNSSQKKKKKKKKNTSSSMANLPWCQRFIISSNNLNSQSISHDGRSNNNYLYDFMIR